MNPRIAKLLKQKKAAQTKANELVELAVNEDRDLTDEEAQAHADFKAEVESCDRRIEQINSLYEISSTPAGADALQIDADSVITNPHPVIEDDPRRGFADVGQFALTVAAASRPGAVLDQRLSIMSAASGMQQSVGSEGGFLVPPQFSAAIWDGMNEAPDNLLPMTDSYPVSGESLTFNANAETSRATGSRYGGVRGYWIAEAEQITSSRPTFRQVKIEPQQLAVLVYVTDKLLANASALDSYMAKAAVEEINFMVGDSIINGTGAGQPRGILTGAVNYPRVRVNKETGQSAATVVYENVLNMYSRLHRRYRSKAVWMINQDIEPQLATMKLDVGTGGVPVYLPAGGASGQPYATLFGLQVMPAEYCATLGTEGDIILANLKAYLTGVKGGVDSAMSMHLRFDYAETCFRFMFQVDGQPWLAQSITPYKGSNTTSPFVTLQTRS